MIALLGLAILWAIVLVPDLLRRGAAARRGDTIGQFARNRSVLQNSIPAGNRRQAAPFGGARQDTVIDLRGPRPVVSREQVAAGPAPAGRTRAQQRRQDILTTLAAAALLSFLGFATFGGVMLIVHIAVDVLLAGYVALWLSVTRRERIRSQVMTLPGHSLAPLAPVQRERHRIAR